MFCVQCQKTVNEDHMRTLENHNIPFEFCSSCWIELWLAEGNCDKCNALVRHRVTPKETVLLQRMAITVGKFIPRISCPCGGMVELTRIANKDFLRKVHQMIPLRRKLEELQYA